MFRVLETTIFLTAYLLFVSGTQPTKKMHSLLGPFLAGNTYLPYWDLTGTSETREDFIRLTSDEPGKKGAIWNNYASELRDWELQMRFLIHGKGVNLNGDGMAIWYAKDPLQLGPVFGSKDYFSGVGVFIDTFRNHETIDASNEYHYPHISVMVNNGTLHYNGAEDGVHTSIGGCHAKIRNLEIPVRIAVSYMRSVFMVFLDTEGFGGWKQCFKSHGIHLPTGYYFGVSASTGELSDNHDVYSITVLDMEASDSEKEDRSGIMPEAEYFTLPKEYKDEREEEKASDGTEEDSSLGTSTLKILLCIPGLAIILSAVIMLCKKYREQRRIKREKRLY